MLFQIKILVNRAKKSTCAYIGAVSQVQKQDEPPKYQPFRSSAKMKTLMLSIIIFNNNIINKNNYYFYYHNQNYSLESNKGSICIDCQGKKYIDRVCLCWKSAQGNRFIAFYCKQGTLKELTFGDNNCINGCQVFTL